MLRMFILAICISPLVSLAQRPSIAPGGVVNAASFWPILAPGSIASVFGQNLASSTAQAQSYPLPVTLAGSSVTVNGVPAPLFYVSPNQINFQVPSSTNAGPGEGIGFGSASVVVVTAGGASEPASANTYPRSFGIFTLDGTGCGPAAVLNIKPDGTVSVNSASNGASPGDYIAIYGTGLGAVYYPPADGSPALANPLSWGPYGSGVTFDGQVVGATYEGRAPGLVGVDQLNVLVPAGVRQGCAVPLQAEAGLTIQAEAGSPVSVSIHSGGGECVDPPLGSAGELVIMKSVVLNDSTVPESDTFTASFSASPGKRPALPPRENISVPTSTLASGPVCAIPGYSTLSAGEITLSGSGLNPIRIDPAVTRGAVSYQSSLPVGALKPGNLQVSASGGDIGPFQTTLGVGPEIKVTSQFPQGQVYGLLRVNWTGGTIGEVVTVRFVYHYFGGDEVSYFEVPATDGTWSLPIHPLQPPVLPPFTEIDVEVGPDPQQPQIISVPGLTLGLSVRWVYQYRFVNLHS